MNLDAAKSISTPDAPPRLSLGGIAASTPAAYFGMVLGLAGLGNGWRVATKLWGCSPSISESILTLAALVWAVLLFLYIVKFAVARDKVLAEAAHPVQCCFIGLIGVATMLIAGAALPHLRLLALVLFVVGFVFTIGFGVWRTGGLWRGGRDPATNTAVLYLPTVAGSFVSATVASALGFTELGQMAFGAGMFSWLAIESVLLHRLLTAPETAVALRPTLGIQLAPAPVGSVAYLSVAGGMPDVFAHALIGYGILQLLVLVRLSPWILEGGLSVSLWAFSFGATSLAVSPLRLATAADPIMVSWLAVVLFLLANVLIIALVVMTLWLLFSGRMYSRR